MLRFSLFFWVLWGAGASAAGADLGFNVQVESLPQALLQKIQSAGLESPGAPEIPAFQWRLDIKRPFRRARQMEERYQGSKAGEHTGMSPTLRYDYPRDGSVATVPGAIEGRAVSVRGLIRVSPEDKQVNARVEGLNFPLATGATFKLSYQESDIDLRQSCAVIEKLASNQLHAALRGEASRIVCTGKGKYKSFDVKVQSNLYFVEALGMFLNTQDLIETPLGKLVASTRILDLRFGL